MDGSNRRPLELGLHYDFRKNGKIEDTDLTKVIQKGNKPEFVTRRGMNDLLQHFGVDSEVRNKLFKKEKESVEVDV